MLKKYKSHGQVSVEYMSYFSVFLLISLAFSAYIYFYAMNNLNDSYNARFQSLTNHFGIIISDCEKLSGYVDDLKYVSKLPSLYASYDVNISIDPKTNYIESSTLPFDNPSASYKVYYYAPLQRRPLGVFYIYSHIEGDSLIIEKRSHLSQDPNLR